MSDDALIGRVAEYYTRKVRDHGATPAGVDWNGERSQLIRFDQLLGLVGPSAESFSINDYGCGYGALFSFLARRDIAFSYRGYDISATMIEAARARFGADPRAEFTTDRHDLARADYTVASGIFNVKLDTPLDRWRRYVLETIDEMVAVSTRGVAFNALTSHSDADRLRDHLYYADPGALLNHCLRHYSRDVALRHDYELYEFTLLVRLDGRPPANGGLTQP